MTQDVGRARASKLIFSQKRIYSFEKRFTWIRMERLPNSRLQQLVLHVDKIRKRVMGEYLVGIVPKPQRFRSSKASRHFLYYNTEQHISKRLSALAVLTRRHRKNKHARPKILARSARQYLQPTSYLIDNHIINADRKSTIIG